MYLDFYGLNNYPFAITPDPAFLYLSGHHRDALGHLLYGTGEHGGFVQLTGEVGTGKTTLIRALLEQEQPELDVALCLNPQLTVREFVAEVADELGVDRAGSDDSSLKSLIDALNQHLLETHAAGRRTVLIVDEAQNLSADVLEQLRLLTNLETHTHKLMRIILVGQPELESLLRRSDLRQLAQRITARYHLRAFNRAETAAYIRHRLRVVGGNSEIFSDRACHAVYAQSGGIPRLINTVCERALMGGYSTGRWRIDAPLVRRAAREALPRADQPPPRRPAWHLAGVGALMIAGAIGFGLHYGLEQFVLVAKASEPDPSPSQTQSHPHSVQQAAPERAGDKLVHAVGDQTTRSGPASDQPSVVAAMPTGARPAENRAQGSQIGTNSEGRSIATRQSGRAKKPASVPATHTRKPEPLPFPESDATITQMLRLWGVFGAPVDTPCWAVKIGDLRCVIIDEGTLKDLIRFNRPALLELAFEQGQRDVLLVGLDKKHATLVFGDGTRRVTREQLKSLWTGEARLIWRQPIDVRNVRPGSVGGAVVWVRRQLARWRGVNLGHTPGKPSPVYDEALAETIRAFQRQHGLTVDGIVGPRTMIALNGSDPAPGTPVLIERESQ